MGANLCALILYIEKFFDIFCGGCNVGINVECKEIIFLDSNKHSIYLYQTFQHLEKDEIFNWIYKIISEYGLSLVSRNGYKFYNCESSAGLGTYNRKPFNRLHEDFNKNKIFDYYYYVIMYEVKILYKKVDTNLNFASREKEVENFWAENNIAQKTIDNREDCKDFTFYDGPPTVNGKPHIGYVLTRVIKDLFPRYHSMKGEKVFLSYGWDFFC